MFCQDLREKAKRDGVDAPAKTAFSELWKALTEEEHEVRRTFICA